MDVPNISRTQSAGLPAIVSDLVGAGFVAGVPRPSGNITGFTHTDAGLGGKWLGLLKEIAPGIKRAGILFNPDAAPGGGNLFLGWFEPGARALLVEPVTMPIRGDSEIETAIAALGRERAGLVTMDDSFMAVHYRTVISSSARQRSSWERHLSGTAMSACIQPIAHNRLYRKSQWLAPCMMVCVRVSFMSGPKPSAVWKSALQTSKNPSSGSPSSL
jgi:hypothetical protein